jgi:uncharacterized protein (DUF169 family)
MDINIVNEFKSKWEKYFGNTNLPIVFWYDEKIPTDVHLVERRKTWNCLIAELARVRNGESLAFESDSVSCGGGKRYCGFSKQIRPDFDYFLSYGKQNELEGERYKKNPEIVNKVFNNTKFFDAAGKSLIFKRWDKLTINDNPQVVVFFATPDVISGLYTLSNFDSETDTNVVAPFASGCGSVILHPLNEIASRNPNAIIGMFDPSARPYMPKNTLSFAVPFNRFLQMIDNMDESFLITDSWAKIKKRIVSSD